MQRVLCKYSNHQTRSIQMSGNFYEKWTGRLTSAGVTSCWNKTSANATNQNQGWSEWYNDRRFDKCHVEEKVWIVHDESRRAER